MEKHANTHDQNKLAVMRVWLIGGLCFDVKYVDHSQTQDGWITFYNRHNIATFAAREGSVVAICERPALGDVVSSGTWGG